MPTYKLNWIKKIQVKSSKNTSNKMGQDLPRKTVTAKHIFLPYLNMSKNLKTFMLTEDENLQLHFNYQLIQSYRIGMKNHTVHRFVLE